MMDCMILTPSLSRRASKANLTSVIRYWRSLRLYTISATELAAYSSLTGDTTRQPDFNQEERLMDDASMALPIGSRGMAKTLLGSGGAARCLLIAARVA